MKLKILLSYILLLLVGLYFSPLQSTIAIYIEQESSSSQDNEIIDEEDLVCLQDRRYHYQTGLDFPHTIYFTHKIPFLPVLTKPPKVLG